LSEKGKVRAEQGDPTFRKILEDLIRKFGQGFSFPELKNIEQLQLTLQLTKKDRRF